MSKNLIRTVWVAILLLSSSSGLVANAIAPSNYSIKFDANAGDGSMPVVKVPTTGKALPASKFTRDGFQFAGWAINPNGVVKYKDKAVLKPKSKLTLFARWVSTVPTPQLLNYSVGKLLWSESFSGPAKAKVSNGNWTTRYCGHSAANGGGSCFGESQYYTPDAIALDGSEQGNAVITTKRVTSAPANSGQCLAAPCRFVSGRFDTQGKVSFKYGYIEARIKMPVGGTNWPAFWALGDSITEVGWPLSGEIDIAEQGGDRPTRNSSAVHYSNQDIATCCDNHRYVVGEIVDEANYQSDFHTYGIAWTPDLMQFYVDRELYWTVYPGNMGEHHWVFNEPFFLILNNATGPFGGNYTGWQTSETKIDYVRAWQLDGQGTVIRH
jgi:beta-glucanase (GH16 family)